MKVYVFIVTYNRLSLLKKTINSLRKQTYPIYNLCVINNGSTDGTYEWLLEQQDLTVIHQENLGGAGGFSRGVQYAYEDGADWIWMLDDDVYPESNCLEQLLKYKEHSLCLQSARYFSDGIYVPWGYRYDLSRDFEEKISADNYKKEFFSVNTGCFEGMLIHRSIVAKIGYPDKRFFITSDDRMYGYLASKHTDLILVRDARLNREATSGEVKYSPFYSYYLYRNFHLRDEYCKAITGKSFPLKVKMMYVLSALKNSLIGYSFLEPSLRKKMRTAIWKGFVDCLRKKENKTF